MPLKVDIDHARRFVTVAATGQVTLQDVLDYFDRLVVDGAMPYPKLFDASDAEPSFSDDDIMTLGARVSAYAAFEPRGAVAIVAKTVTAKNAALRFMNLGNPERPARLFEQTADALQWLGNLSTE